MKSLLMVIMIRLTKIATLFVVGVLLFSCKKNIAQSVTTNIDSYTSYKASNVKEDYRNLLIKISKDSIKVIDLNLNNAICFGKIIKRRTTFSKYFHSVKTGSEIKRKLQKEYKLLIKDSSIFSIKNYYPNNSIKPCEFPFSDLFIVDNDLFFYDDGYHLFTDIKVSKGEQAIKTDYSKSRKTYIDLPFETNGFLKETEKSNREKYKIVEGELLKSLDGVLFKGFYSEEDEAISSIYKLNIGGGIYETYIVVSENFVGYDYSIVSIKNKVLVSGLFLVSKEVDAISNNVIVDDQLVIKLVTLEGEKFAEYKISEKGLIEQVFDNREQMKNYQSHIQSE